MKGNTRFPAEWEPADAVLVAWPHSDTDWCRMLPDVRACYADIIRACATWAKVIIIGPEEPEEKYLPEGDLRDNVIYINIPTNDTWTRDYGPISTVNSEGRLAFNDFQFNGWGLKFAADKDNLATKHLFATGLFDTDLLNRLSFVLEGGSVESDGNGTILTTTSCLLSPNRNGADDIPEIEAYLSETLGARKVNWLQNGELAGDDTDGHIDTLARIVPPGDTIMYVGCNDAEDEHYAPLKAMCEELKALTDADGNPYHLIELPLPSAMYDPEDGTRLPATYANFLILNGAVILPVYSQPKNDLLALMTVKAAFPDYEVITVDCRALVRQHGSLHCATMQLPKGSMIIK